MLDDNLPTFFLRPSATNQSHRRDLHLSYHGSEPTPTYILRYIEPSERNSPSRRNCYAVGLFDAFNPDILFGEVLVEPEWTSMTLSQDEIRRNGGIPPPPQPIVPLAFPIQLYNPEQQIMVELKEGKWGASDSYEFSLPISTFRTPSASNLDRGQSDPASLPNTPKVHFTWRKESKLSKDLTCFMTGKSTDPPDWKKKKRSRNDPDITIALWRSLREMTIYEPNLSRVDLEDPKGLELALLLSAIVIKDLYLNNREDVRSMFNVTPLPSEQGIPANGLADVRRASTKAVPPGRGTSFDSGRADHGPSNRVHSTPPAPPPRPADPRTQWKVEAETAQLKQQVAAEEQAARLAQQRRLKAKEKEDEAERKRLLRVFQEEEQEEQRRRLDVDRETERLRRMYGAQTLHQADNHGGLLAVPSGVHPPLMSGANSALRPSTAATRPHKKKSMFGLRSSSDDSSTSRLVRKQSSMW